MLFKFNTFRKKKCYSLGFLNNFGIFRCTRRKILCFRKRMFSSVRPYFNKLFWATIRAGEGCRGEPPHMCAHAVPRKQSAAGTSRSGKGSP